MSREKQETNFVSLIFHQRGLRLVPIAKDGWCMWNALLLNYRAIATTLTSYQRLFSTPRELAVAVFQFAATAGFQHCNIDNDAAKELSEQVQQSTARKAFDRYIRTPGLFTRRTADDTPFQQYLDSSYSWTARFLQCRIAVHMITNVKQAPDAWRLGEIEYLIDGSIRDQQQQQPLEDGGAIIRVFSHGASGAYHISRIC